MCVKLTLLSPARRAMVNMCDSSDDDAVFVSTSRCASYTGLWARRRPVIPGKCVASASTKDHSSMLLYDTSRYLSECGKIGVDALAAVISLMPLPLRCRLRRAVREARQPRSDMAVKSLYSRLMEVRVLVRLPK